MEDEVMGTLNEYQQYTAEDLENAVKAVKNGLLICEASRSDNIPYSTLNDHVNENVTSFGSGRNSIFSEIEEMNLMNAVLMLQDWGDLQPINDPCMLAEQYVIQLGKGAMFKTDRPSYDWIQDFLKRHPTLTMKTSTALERCRAALTVEQIDE
ncbi:unnamed protein product [Didymodactylos carnosus]|uniref:HTH psq-type domain-containing protein n=1 Tax=Didymodactylos carnosus TaxID=1234261 RepID=A0A8S2E723_9BILA|nr:unnamed protein product [Didymodactylos carnosus]CAF3844770.1 unnamed protein product [Didymodactylos carnosus]